MQINTCVLGYGLSAQTFQIPFIVATEGLRLHSILQRPADPTAATAPGPAAARASAAVDCPGVTIHPSIDAVCADGEIELAVVSTANASHYALASALLHAGKHVVVEKPFTVTSAEADALVALAANKHRVLTVFHNRRWDADFLTLRRLLAAGTFGTLVSLESHFDRFKPWPPAPSSATAPSATTRARWKEEAVLGNGVLYDLGSHLIDQALVLFGLPDRVYGSVRDERGGWRYGHDAAFLDDAFDAVLYYDATTTTTTTTTTTAAAAAAVASSGSTRDRGLMVRLSASSTSLCARQTRFVVRGSAAGWEKRGLDPQEGQAKGGMRVDDARFGCEEDPDTWGVLTTPEQGRGGLGATHQEAVPSERGCYRRFLANVAAVLRGREPCLEVLPQQAADVVRVIELVFRSEREGRVLPVRAGATSCA